MSGELVIQQFRELRSFGGRRFGKSFAQAVLAKRALNAGMVVGLARKDGFVERVVEVNLPPEVAK